MNAELIGYINNSDNVVKTGGSSYLTQCTQYKRVFTFNQLVDYLLREYFS
jgi:hypothetical protein